MGLARYVRVEVRCWPAARMLAMILWSLRFLRQPQNRLRRHLRLPG